MDKLAGKTTLSSAEYEKLCRIYLRAAEILYDFDNFGEVIQTDENGEYSEGTPIEALRAAINDYEIA